MVHVLSIALAIEGFHLLTQTRLQFIYSLLEWLLSRISLIAPKVPYNSDTRLKVDLICIVDGCYSVSDHPSLLEVN